MSTLQDFAVMREALSLKACTTKAYSDSEREGAIWLVAEARLRGATRRCQKTPVQALTYRRRFTSYWRVRYCLLDSHGISQANLRGLHQSMYIYTCAGPQFWQGGNFDKPYKVTGPQRCSKESSANALDYVLSTCSLLAVSPFASTAPMKRISAAAEQRENLLMSMIILAVQNGAKFKSNHQGRLYTWQQASALYPMSSSTRPNWQDIATYLPRESTS